jgi:hypothetical protein
MGAAVKLGRATMGCACLLLASSLAHSADDWRFQATVYGYLPSIGGTTTFPPAGGAPSVGIDTSDILEHLKLAFMAVFDASSPKWGVVADVMYVDIGDTRTQTREASLGGSQIPTGAAADLDLNFKGWLWTLVATYTATDTEQGRLQAFAGARLLDTTQDLDWTLSGNVGSIATPGRGEHTSTRTTNWDAIVGVRGRRTFGAQHAWFAPYYLDFGTGQSDFTWQALLGLGYTFRWGDVLAAWRYIDYDMKTGTSIQRLTLDGPAVGVTFRW